VGIRGGLSNPGREVFGTMGQGRNAKRWKAPRGMPTSKRKPIIQTERADEKSFPFQQKKDERRLRGEFLSRGEKR